MKYSIKELENMVEKDLPGWKLELTLEQLKLKFGVDVEKPRLTLFVKPDSGGPSKTADIVNGKVVIVQG